MKKIFTKKRIMESEEEIKEAFVDRLVRKNLSKISLNSLGKVDMSEGPKFVLIMYNEKTKNFECGVYDRDGKGIFIFYRKIC